MGPVGDQECQLKKELFMAHMNSRYHPEGKPEPLQGGEGQNESGGREEEGHKDVIDGNH